MKLHFKQRFFSWFDSYDIYDEAGEVYFTVKGQLAWGHLLNIYDRYGSHIATLKQKIFTLLPKFEIYIGNQYVGEIMKEFTFFKPSFKINCNGWDVQGDWLEWEYRITSGPYMIAHISKQLLNFTDTYSIDISNPDDGLMALMVTLAIDAIKSSKKNNGIMDLF